MYNEKIINTIKEFLNEDLENLNKQLTGEIDYFQGYLLGRKSIIEFVLNSIDIGKDDK